MDAFNAVAGIITVASLLFSFWVFLDSRRKEAVEQEKVAVFVQRLADLLSMANAAAQQGVLAANLSDREDTTKKELKHLIVAQLATMDSLQSALKRAHGYERRWRFGIPGVYLSLEAQDPNEGELGTHGPQQGVGG